MLGARVWSLVRELKILQATWHGKKKKKKAKVENQKGELKNKQINEKVG